MEISLLQSPQENNIQDKTEDCCGEDGDSVDFPAYKILNETGLTYHYDEYANGNWHWEKKRRRRRSNLHRS